MDTLRARKTALFTALIGTVVCTVLRTVLTPMMQDAQTGVFHISYVVIGALCLFMLLSALIALRNRQPLPEADRFSKAGKNVMGLGALFCGSLLVLVTLFDAGVWMTFGKTPAPNEYVISELDEVTLKVTLVLGVLAGLYLIWLGFLLLGNKLRRSSLHSLVALAPPLWMWFRLVRYEVSYASAIQVSQGFYDFVMLIFSLLFLFAFARYISGVGKRSSRVVFIYALCTVIMSLSATIAGLVFYFTGENEAYNASPLAGAMDFGLAVFAITAAYALAFPAPANTLPDDTAEELSLKSDTPEESNGWQTPPTPYTGEPQE